MKNIVLAGYSGYKKKSDVINFVESFKNIQTPNDNLLIAYSGDKTEINEYLDERGVDTVRMKSKSNHRYVDRFDWFSDLLRGCDADKVLTSDITDVVFQSNPFYWMKENLNKDILVCDEGHAFENASENWNALMAKTAFPDDYKDLKNKNIYNVGVVGGNPFKVKGVLGAVYDMCKGNCQPDNIDFELVHDQAAYSILCHLRDYAAFKQPTSNKGNFCFTMGLISHMEGFYLIDGKICNELKEPYTMLHQYDRHTRLSYDLESNLIYAGEEKLKDAYFRVNE